MIYIKEPTTIMLALIDNFQQGALFRPRGLWKYISGGGGGGLLKKPQHLIIAIY